MSRRVVVVQARMSSTRLPGKVLMDLGGRPMLARQLDRLARCRRVDDVTVATTTNATDDPLVALARAAGVRWFRGSEHDVLARYAGAAREADADVVVRVTADCPLIDAEITDRVIDALTSAPDGVDYASNAVRRSYPRGLDTEAFWRDTLDRVVRLARSQPAREHVTWFVHAERPDLFRQEHVVDVEDNSDLRWTVDVREDLELVRRLYADLDLAERPAGYREIVRHVRAHPELAALNACVVQRTA